MRLDEKRVPKVRMRERTVCKRGLRRVCARKVRPDKIAVLELGSYKIALGKIRANEMTVGELGLAKTGALQIKLRKVQVLPFHFFQVEDDRRVAIRTTNGLAKRGQIRAPLHMAPARRGKTQARLFAIFPLAFGQFQLPLKVNLITCRTQAAQKVLRFANALPSGCLPVGRASGIG